MKGEVSLSCSRFPLRNSGGAPPTTRAHQLTLLIQTSDGTSAVQLKSKRYNEANTIHTRRQQTPIKSNNPGSNKGDQEQKCLFQRHQWSRLCTFILETVALFRGSHQDGSVSTVGLVCSSVIMNRMVPDTSKIIDTLNWILKLTGDQFAGEPNVVTPFLSSRRMAAAFYDSSKLGREN